jgi:hypothetical protein
MSVERACGVMSFVAFSLCRHVAVSVPAKEAFRTGTADGVESCVAVWGVRTPPTVETLGPALRILVPACFATFTCSRRGLVGILAHRALQAWMPAPITVLSCGAMNTGRRAVLCVVCIFEEAAVSATIPCD